MTSHDSTVPAPAHTPPGQIPNRTVSSTAGDRPSIPLETEPLVFFHPLLAGLANPGNVQPVPHALLLEEGPATWPELAT